MLSIWITRSRPLQHRLVLILAVSVLAAACTVQGDDTVKPLPPGTATLIVDQDELEIGQHVGVEVRCQPNDADVKGVCGFSANGNAVTPHSKSQELPELEQIEAYTMQTEVLISDYGEGTLRASLTVYDDDGALLYETGDVLYLLITNEGAFSGNTGFLALRQSHLETQRELNLLSEQEFQDQLEALLGGGAEETVIITTPSP